MEIKFSKRDILVLCLLLSLSFFLFGLAVSERSEPETERVTSERLVPIYKVDREEKQIAITLDGMWGTEYTRQLLDIFRQYDLDITFFFGGNWLEENRELVTEIADQGHEIGNHSYTHPHMTQLNQREIKKELEQTNQLIKSLTGEESNLFRPPFGDYDNQLISTCRQEGYNVIQWSIDSLDWKDVEAEFIINRVLEKVEPGDIILMHNNATATPKALKVLIPELKQRGYEILPVSELIYDQDYKIESHSGLQKKIDRGDGSE